jgi:hypothetical protein
MTTTIPHKKQECQAPNCTAVGSNTYIDDNGNTLQLCDRHYYHAVSDDTVAGYTFDPDTDSFGYDRRYDG